MESLAESAVNPAEHLKLVCLIANKLAYRPFVPKRGRVPLEDTEEYAEGCLGLVEAARRFDASLGFKFSTYATHYVRGYILRLKDPRLRQSKERQHVPFSALGDMAALEDEGSLTEYLLARAFLNEEAELTEASDWIGWALGKVGDRRARKMLVQHVLFGRTLDDVGKEHGVTKERVRQLVDRALKQMALAVYRAGFRKSDFKRRSIHDPMPAGQSRKARPQKSL
jgi:RNA polymerase sigma factor (sigma-70 family)